MYSLMFAIKFPSKHFASHLLPHSALLVLTGIYYFDKYNLLNLRVDGSVFQILTQFEEVTHSLSCITHSQLK